MRIKRLLCTFAATICLYMIIDWINTPPVGSVVIDDINDYFCINEYVQGILDEEFIPTMPQALPEHISAAQYHYQYDCGLLGDASFYMRLVIQYSDSSEFFEECGRLSTLAPHDIFDCGNSNSYLIFSGDNNSFSRFLDDVILDGSLWQFNIVCINPDVQRIEYTLAHCFDGCDKNPNLVHTIESVYSKAQ